MIRGKAKEYLVWEYSEEKKENNKCPLIGLKEEEIFDVLFYLRENDYVREECKFGPFLENEKEQITTKGVKWADLEGKIKFMNK